MSNMPIIPQELPRATALATVRPYADAAGSGYRNHETAGHATAVQPHDRSPRKASSRALGIAMGIVLATAGVLSLTGPGPFQGVVHALGYDQDTASAMVQTRQSAEMARMRASLSAVLDEIETLKSRESSVDPSVTGHLAEIDSKLAMLKLDAGTLRAAQSDTSEELGHIRAEVANADIGLEKLRLSLGERDPTQVKDITTISSRVDRLEHAGAADTTSSISSAHPHHSRHRAAHVSRRPIRLGTAF